MKKLRLHSLIFLYGPGFSFNASSIMLSTCNSRLDGLSPSPPSGFPAERPFCICWHVIHGFSYLTIPIPYFWTLFFVFLGHSLFYLLLSLVLLTRTEASNASLWQSKWKSPAYATPLLYYHVRIPFWWALRLVLFRSPVRLRKVSGPKFQNLATPKFELGVQPAAPSTLWFFQTWGMKH